MALTLPVAVMAKTKRKTRKQSTPLPPTAAHGVELKPAEAGGVHEKAVAFNPHVFLTKLAAGKTAREYKGDESVFSQGDPADEVFYIQSGKVKLTAVSAQGKEAVVAILPEGS